MEIKKGVMDLKRSKAKLETTECGIQGEKRNIYINDDLPKPIRELYKKARELRSHGFRYVWCKLGKIYARKDEGQELVKIFNKEQVGNIIKGM